VRAFTFERAGTVTEALQRVARAPETSVVAGGTTLIDLVKLDVMRPAHVVGINRVGLDRVELLEDGRIRVGALVRNSDLAWHHTVRERYPVLAEAVLSGATSQLRNMATTGGNLMQRTRCQYFRDNLSPCNKREPGSGCAAMEGCNRSHAVLGTSEKCIATHPSDMCVALAVLDAEIVVQGEAGERRIAFEDFHLLPGETPEREHALKAGELITAVVLPPLPAGTRSWYLKLRDRESYEFALASAAVTLRIDAGRIAEARLALGGVGTKPWRAREAEETLRGATIDETVFRRAAELALRDARPREHNRFKVELARRVIGRAFSEIAERQPEVRSV
jgi:xanthine dehydrogenase YagS FAD-binding subunit